MAVKGLLEFGEALAKAAKNYGNTPLPNAPMPANVPGAGPVNIGPNPAAEQAAIQYSQSSGIPYTPVTSFMPADPQFGARVAREYELMPHDPTNRRVQQSYNALADEIAGQYEAMLRAGIKPEFNQNPYPQSPYLGLMDMLETGRLQVYPTRAGFGMDDAFDSSQNLLLAESPFKISGQPATFNDLFRAVHDFQGHAKVGAGFRGAGEEMAYLSHAGTMSPDALKALASETRGQNSWLNYGPFGDANRTAGIDDTVFAEQKSGLLPNWAIQERLPELDVRRQRFNELRAKYDTGLEGAIDDSGNLTLVHYSPKPIERVDPNFYGKGLSGRTREEINRRYSEDFVPRSYYGIEADVNPYAKELGLGANKVETQIDAAQIYDVKKDPEGLWKDGKGDVTKSEKNLWDKGYSGYFVDNQRLGKVAAIFDPLDVTKKLMVPLVPTAAAGLAALAPQEADASMVGLLSKFGASRADLKGMAEKMLDGGASPDEIWAKTGWEYNEADKLWRTELPNSKSELNLPSPGKDQKARAKLGDIINDPELLSQYDDRNRLEAGLIFDETEEYGSPIGGPRRFTPLSDIPVIIDNNLPVGYGFHAPASSQAGESIRISGQGTPESQRATLLHEMQHSIQDREGFASGGSEEYFKSNRQATNKWSELYGPRLQDLQDKRLKNEDEIDEMMGLEGLKSSITRDYADSQQGLLSPEQMYRNLVGEVEAENVVTRDSLTPDDLRIKRPGSTEQLSSSDILGRDQQIVRMGSYDPIDQEVGLLTNRRSPEYTEEPVIEERSFGSMVQEYGDINRRLKAADDKKFALLMAEEDRLGAMSRAQPGSAWGKASPELAAYRRSQLLPMVAEIGMGGADAVVSGLDFLSNIPGAAATMNWQGATPIRDRLGGLLDYTFVDERDQRTRDSARLLGGLLSPI